MPAIKTPKKLLKLLKKKGFYKHHQVGSHLVLKSVNDHSLRVTLPLHNRDLKQGTLNSILKQCGIDKKIFLNKFMQKRVFFIHGWGGSPEEGWRPWLKEELEANGFTVINLPMPNTNYPQMNEWISTLQDAAGIPDKNCYFVGHSLGCITILRYLEGLTESQKVGGALLVAAFTDDLDIKEIKNFFIKDISWEKIKKRCSKFIVLLSDNDPYVDVSYGKIFEKKLNAKVIIKHNMKHFSGDDGTVELPEALSSVLQLAKL